MVMVKNLGQKMWPNTQFLQASPNTYGFCALVVYCCISHEKEGKK